MIVNGVTRTGISIPGLADRADVDEILRIRLNGYRFRCYLAHLVRLHIHPRHMGVPVKAELSELVGKVRHRIEAIGHIVPMQGLVEGAVDDREIGNLPHHPQPFEPQALVVVELLTGPLKCDGGHGVHAVQ